MAPEVSAPEVAAPEVAAPEVSAPEVAAPEVAAPSSPQPEKERSAYYSMRRAIRSHPDTAREYLKRGSHAVLLDSLRGPATEEDGEVWNTLFHLLRRMAKTSSVELDWAKRRFEAAGIYQRAAELIDRYFFLALCCKQSPPLLPFTFADSHPLVFAGRRWHRATTETRRRESSPTGKQGPGVMFWARSSISLMQTMMGL